MIRKFTSWTQPKNDFPTRDGRPVAETDIHRTLMFDLIAILSDRYADQSDVYVSGDLLICYDPKNKRRHITPNVFVIFGVPKGPRDNYLLFDEGKGPDVVIEVTSKTTKNEDLKKKPELYRTKLGVKEYFLFDPTEDYLTPSLQGFRLVGEEFQPIQLVAGRLPSQQLGLHLERAGEKLRLWDPETGLWIPTPSERISVAEATAEAEQAARLEAEAARAAEQASRLEAELKAERLQRELEELRRRLAGNA